MSRNGKEPSPPAGWLTPDQQRAWLAYIRVQLRLRYEMNRQLQSDSGISLSDYDVLTALSVAPEGHLQMTALANQIGWERTRASHHARRMEARGLLVLRPSKADRRATEVSLSDEGRDLLAQAAPGHVGLVQNLFFAGLPDELLPALTEAMETIYENILANGTLPPPPL
ncbi:MarR family winged helix-turn-helix transcriptional regulator [Amycolatopsis cynarae]|uniref:MarR family winged helix-turn-helix transcriptional regulator n=1 Tax=Amycolatopsis cynarae TaxID=2995223 RepID=A0ABY7AX51_9PSEU|nr:MarR family winged helix-turn-helix transcriptional regulator [Amycolatopsis sp. HUAS 11-8]WAL64302.1 MarR family winged helix-turn-helix transcriptional regulator [Amycolatopsis sp. HUAS 11-8]